jgi:threonine/homoserine/homoserine lactone efflux protein
MNAALLTVFPLIVMMFVGSITPGPNNLMLMLAGTRFGFAPIIPHLAGVTAGTTLAMCLTMLGLSVLMLGHPRIVDAMTVACAAYLLWMAKKLLTAPAPGAAGGPLDEPRSGRPMRFTEAVLFQFVNPKVWTMAIAAGSIAARFPFRAATSIAVVGVVTAVVNAPCIALWAAFGKVMRRQLQDARRRRWFDGSMAALTVATAVWIVWPVLIKLT